MNVLVTRALAGSVSTCPGCLSAGAHLDMCLTETPTPVWILMSASLIMVAASISASTCQALHSAGEIMLVGIGIAEEVVANNPGFIPSFAHEQFVSVVLLTGADASGNYQYFVIHSVVFSQHLT